MEISKFGQTTTGQNILAKLGHDKGDYELNAVKIFSLLKEKDPDQWERVAQTILQNYTEWYEDSKEEYILSLFFPEWRSPCRFPGLVPIPTHVFTERLSTTWTPNATNTMGNVWIQMNPQASNVLQKNAIVEYSSDIAGYINSANYEWNLKPETYYKQYRCVAACIIVTYIGDVEHCKGELYGAIEFDSQCEGAAMETSNNFENKYYCDKNPTMQGQKVIWIPKDTKDLEFRKNTDYTGHVVQILGVGLPITIGAVLKIDFYRTIEGVPLTTYHQILNPQTCTPPGPGPDVMEQIQNATKSQGIVSVPKQDKKSAKEKMFDVAKGIGSTLVNKAGDFVLDLAKKGLSGNLMSLSNLI